MCLKIIKRIVLVLTCPPIDNPVRPRGPNPCCSHQLRITIDSKIKQPPMIKISVTLCKLERLSFKPIQIRSFSYRTIDKDSNVIFFY